MKHSYYKRLIMQPLVFFLILSISYNTIADTQPVFEFAELGGATTEFANSTGTKKPIYRGEKKILKEIEHLNEDVIGVGRKVQHVDGDVYKVEKKVQQVDRDVENIENIVINIHNQIGDCYNTTVCAELEEIKNIVDNITINVSVAESIVEDISDRIGDCTICETLSIIESKIDALDLCESCEPVSIIESVVENISDRIGDCTVCQTLATIESKIDVFGACNLCQEASIIESVIENISNKIGLCTLCDELSIIDSKIDELLSDDSCNATPIIAPMTITQPGSYCLAKDIMGTVTIAANNVSINLNNFTISSLTNGIESTGQNFITIQNGTIQADGYGVLFTGITDSKIVNCDFQTSGTGCSINQSQQIIIDNCRAMANQNGFSFLESSTCCVRNSIALDQLVDGFLFDTCFAIDITDCIAMGNGTGYQLLNSFNTTVINVIGSANGTGFDSEGSKNLIIEASNFDFNTAESTGLTVKGGRTGANITTNKVSTSGNRATGLSGLGLAEGHGTFMNHLAIGNGGDGVSIAQSTDVAFKGHSHGNGGVGFKGDSNVGLMIDAHVNANQGAAGIQLSNTSNLTLSGKCASNIGHGFDLTSLSNFAIQNATITASGQRGINLTACQNGQLMKNTVNNSGDNGIHLDEASTECTTNNCTTLQNSGVGVNNMGGMSNALYGNNAKSNTVNFDGVINKYVAINEIQNRNSDLDILSDVNNLPPQTIIISNPGVYTMTRTFSGQIIIEVSNVTLDLGGNIITGDFSQTTIAIPAGIVSVLPGNNNITILNGVINLVDSPVCPSVGIAIDLTNNITITDIIINNSQSDISSPIGIDINAATSSEKISNLVIDNVIINNAINGAGIDIINCDNILIRNFKTSLNDFEALNIQLSVNGVIDSCSLSNNSGVGIRLNSCQGYSITNSEFSNDDSGVQLASCSDCSITNCSCIGNVGSAIFLFLCTGCSINQCLTDGFAQSGVGLSQCSECIIDGCTANNVTVAGYNFDTCQNCIIRNSNAKQAVVNLTSSGIIFSSTQNSLISSCFCEQFFAGIEMINSTTCVIENSRTTNNYIGVSIHGPLSSNCEVKSCVASSNFLFGFSDESAMSLTDQFINNIGHTNPFNYDNIAPITTDQVNGGYFNNLSI